MKTATLRIISCSRSFFIIPFFALCLFILVDSSPTADSLISISSDSIISNEKEFLECLFQNATLSSQDIYTPEDPSYSYIFNSTARNKRVTSTSSSNYPFNRGPIAILTPHLESQIQSAVYCSKVNGIQIRVRSGGHDYEGLSFFSHESTPFAIVDMRNMASIYSIDTEIDNSAWVQAGATLGELYYAVAKKSRTRGVVGGVCPTVGIGGHLSGGGYSMMSRKYGMGSDNIIDAILIDAEGRILDRGSMGEDLFWAIRGGGGTSFGIITAFKVRLVVVPEKVIVFDVSRTLEQNATQLVHRWQYVADKIDENLSIRLSVRKSSRDSSSSNNYSTIVASFTSLFIGGGRVEDLLRLMGDEFPELGLVKEDCMEMSWIESVFFFANLGPNSTLDDLLDKTSSTRFSILPYSKGKSDFATQAIPEYGLRGMWEFLMDDESKYHNWRFADLTFSPFGGFLSTLSESETPFPHRVGNIFMIHHWVGWNGAEENTEAGDDDSRMNLNWIQSLYSYMAPYVSKSPRGAYFNYRDLDLGMNNANGETSYEEASVWGLNYFKNNFNRLVRVKTRVDPSNFFRNEQSIPPLSLSPLN